MIQDIRVKIDKRQDKLNGKVKNAQLEKVPYMLVIGKEEKEENKVAVRHRLRGMIGKLNLDEFVTIIKQEVTEKRDINKEVPH